MHSFAQMKLVPADTLQERIELVRILSEEENEAYRIVKDKLTGEHYLDFVYIQVHIAQGGEQETFHQLMPLTSDDVLGILFGNEPYRYPEAWNAPFLRNGPDGQFVWFDPEPERLADDYDQLGRELLDKLNQFKRSRVYDKQSVQQLLQDLDRLEHKREEG